MRIILLISLVVLGCARSAAADKVLNLFIWSEYVDPAVIKDFEARFQCKVVMDLYEDAESMLAKLQAGGKGLYDVTVPPDYILPAMVKLKLLEPLRKQSIPNLKNLEDRFLNPPYDRGNRFSVAYQWGTVGILYRPEPGKTYSPTWGLVLDSARQVKPYLLIDSMRDLVGAGLKYQGSSLNSVDLTALKKVRQLLVDAKKGCASMEGSVGGKNKVVSKAARAAIVYSGEGARAMSEDSSLVYFIPKEGSQIWVDNLVIPVGAPHRELAEQFINFMLDGEVGARISNFTQFTTPNKASKPQIKPELLKNPAIYPTEETMKKLEFLEDLGSNTRIYDEIWTQVKSAAP